MKRITRDRLLTDEEAAEDQAIREGVAKDLPELIAEYQALQMASKTGQILDDQAQSRAEVSEGESP